MSWKRPVYLLTSWEPASGKIRRRLFLRSEIFFGADPKADIKTKASGFSARLSFVDQELEEFQESALKKVGESEIFFLEEKAYTWKQLRLKVSPTLWFGLLGVFILFAVALYSKESCSTEFLQNPKLSDEMRSQLSALESFFETAASQQNILVARAELFRARKLIEANGNLATCGQSFLSSLEERWAELVILRHIQDGNLLDAVYELLRLRENHKTSLSIMEERVLAATKRLYWKSWRLERSDPTASYKLAKQVREICDLLGRPSACFSTEQAKNAE